jgi:plastocyanin domain-containing protein
MKILVLMFTLVFSTIVIAKDKENEYKMTVTENGFEPSSLKVKVGKPVTLKITRKTNATCAREITVPSQKLRVDLPLDKEVTVKLASLSKGEIKFGCAMDMMIGGVMFAE